MDKFVKVTKLNDFCSNCNKEKTITDNYHETFTKVDDKTYCDDCFDILEDNIFFCANCCDHGHKNEDINKKYIEKYLCGELVYYHTKCIPDYFLCPICKNDLDNNECIEIFIGENTKIDYHKKCVQEKLNNIYDYSICKDCGISLKATCEGCEHIFIDCYNPNCTTYGCYNFDDVDRYDGYCSKCNW